MKHHILKTDPEVFQACLDGEKNFEIRLDDRGYMVGDTIESLETKFSGEEMKNGSPLEYTGRKLLRSIDYILYGGIYGLEKGWVIMSISAFY